MKLQIFENSFENLKINKRKQEAQKQTQQKSFESLLNNNLQHVVQKIAPTDETYKQKFNKKKQHIEDGKLMDGEEEESVLKTVNTMKKKLKSLVELERRMLGL